MTAPRSTPPRANCTWQRCWTCAHDACVGFALSEHHDAELARARWRGVAVRGGQVGGVVLHTDQGSEYTAGMFAQACGPLGVSQSMGRTGIGLDNAVIEAWNSTLELELLRQQRIRRPVSRHAGGRDVDR